MSGPRRVSVLLIGPHDPHCGEYTFLAPPLGVWRLEGLLNAAGLNAQVFDPNCRDGSPEEELAGLLESRPWSLVGVSTTGMTLRFDLALAHLVHRICPSAVLVAGGMEATFRPELLFQLAPFDLIALGEGEGPLLEIANRLLRGESLDAIPGTAARGPEGQPPIRHHQRALERQDLVLATQMTPYQRMPYGRYWERLESAYRVGALPFKADREARLAEIRSVRLNTLNYCPMACSFCSSTNFLHAAQGSVAKVGRLDAAECLQMISRIVAAQPGVRTVIFQDDIFVFTNDDRILPLCDGIAEAKSAGQLPPNLQFISTNRIDAMTPERLRAMRRAGFRVLGFGVESFNLKILREFNKARIFPYIERTLRQALDLGLTPFLDLILSSPRCSLGDIADNLRTAYRWVLAGCEVGMYPYVIPFSGAAMAADPELIPHTVFTRHPIAGTEVVWDQPSKILPVDPGARDVILAAERGFDRHLSRLETEVAHLPSRIRSLLWIASAIPHLEAAGEAVPTVSQVVRELIRRLPGLDDVGRVRWRRRLLEGPSPRSARSASL